VHVLVESATISFKLCLIALSTSGGWVWGGGDGDGRFGLSEP
jgi:hypothetical protein